MKNVNSNLTNIVEMEHIEMMENDPDMLKEYDFSKGIRGKYAAAYREGCNIIARDPDLNDVLPDEDEKC